MVPEKWQIERAQRFLDALNPPKIFKNPSGICLCGCGQKTPNLDSSYAKGHQNKGKHISKETRAKLSKIKKGKVGYWKGKKRPSPSIEARKNMSEGQKRRPPRPHHTIDARAKIAKAMIGRIYPFKDTKPERLLQEALTKRKIQFVKHLTVFGRPDIAFPAQKIAVFVDGDYWHANPEYYEGDKNICKGYSASHIWRKDLGVNLYLLGKGWKVFRFWEHDINANAGGIAKEIGLMLLN
jgi:DNA mismatch endonuclease (patch repair protein)